MDKVISINLNGRSFQLDEKGYGLLNDYLKTASERLKNDPDRDEIISDLEAAIAEKLNRLLSDYKTVVTAEEIETIIKEMGPVEGGSEENSRTKDPSAEPVEKKKRLFRITEGKMLGGVCMGLAAYFDVDVTLIRIIFIVLGFITQGAMILAYIVMMLIIPKAKTSEQMAAAYGEPLTAQELIRRAKEEFAEISDKDEWKKWKREFRHKVRQQKKEWRSRERYATSSGSGFFGLIILAFIIFWIIGLISIITTGVVFGFLLPISWPLWAVILGWIFIFILIINPLSQLSHGNYHGNHYYHGGGIFSLLWIIFFAWLIWHFIPGSHQYFHQGYEMMQRGIEAIKNAS